MIEILPKLDCIAVIKTPYYSSGYEFRFPVEHNNTSIPINSLTFHWSTLIVEQYGRA
jgi:hypothetical protein